jgi:hypothetical protein
LLAGFADFIRPNARGADAHGFVGAVGHNHMNLLQVGLLEKPVMLVREANFI